MTTTWMMALVAFLIISGIMVTSAAEDLSMTCSGGCQIERDSIIKAQDKSTLTINLIFSKYDTLLVNYDGAAVFTAIPAFPSKSLDQNADTRFILGDFKDVENEKVMLPFSLRNVSLLKDDNKKITYILRSGRDNTNGTRTLNVLAPPKVCGPLKLKNKYTFQEKRQNSITFSLCGNPAPQVISKIGSQHFTTTRNEVTAQPYQHQYVTSLNSLTRNECGKMIQFEVKNSNILLTASINMQFVPTQVENISAQLDHSNCVVATWKRMEVGACAIQYELKHSPHNGTTRTYDLKTQTKWTKCNATLLDTINIRAFYTPEFGAYNDKEVVVRPPPVIITNPPTTQVANTLSPSKDTSKQSDDTSMHWKYILAIVVGVIALILIIAVVVIATRRKRSSKGDNNNGQLEVLKSLEESDYAEVNSLRSVPSSKDPPPSEDDAHLIYAELGPGGGRTGPKPVPEESNYARVKTDGVYYPPLQQSSFRGDGPRKSNFFEPPKYSVASRNKKPSDDDDYVEDILV